MRGSAARPLKERAMALKIYGIPRSRAFRTLWMAKELGLDYENIPIDTQGGSRAPDFLKINPNGHIPAIDDDGVVRWEIDGDQPLSCEEARARQPLPDPLRG